MTEREKMVAGELYDALDPELREGRIRARRLCRAMATIDPASSGELERVIQSLLGTCEAGTWIEPPFFCDYGFNIHLGASVYMNFNCIILDPAPVTLGDRVKLGPNVQLYTATHPVDPDLRRGGREMAYPIHVGDDAWLGGGVIVCPGVTIGERSVIGSGSVVTKDIPAGVVAAGNPCRVLRDVS